MTAQKIDRNLGFKPKGHKKALKITAGVFLGLLLIIGILFAANYNTVMLMLGHGSVRVNSMDELKKNLKSDGVYQNIKSVKSPDGVETLTADSKDGSVKIEAVKQNNGTVKISGNVDINKVDALNKKKVGISDIQSMKSVADQYVNPLVDPQSVSGVEVYVAKEVMAQYQDKKQNFTVSKDLGQGADLNVSGDFSTGKIQFEITK